MDNLKIMDLPENERPRERLIKYGPNTLSNSELLAIILRSGTKYENVIELSNRLLKESSGINALLKSNYEELTSLKGIKKAKATQILALSELFKRFNSYFSGEAYKVSSPKDVFTLVKNEMSLYDKEVLKVIILDSKNRVICYENISIGSLNSSIVHPREVFKEAIRKSGASIVICHNHPSGDSTPSKEDINVTIRLKECGKMLGVELIDHIIIGMNNYVSLKEKGLL
ncbi:RadC family protein [Clostridium hydrogeniformans]|uniref:RadC family protein n=1 Tax=Clostridium hydrogeniformans TaxID=349933 RepID=UPI000486EB54|nr:DNA repair protein RadC [Clostridium hydrogeniformans]